MIRFLLLVSIVWASALADSSDLDITPTNWLEVKPDQKINWPSSGLPDKTKPFYVYQSPSKSSEIGTKPLRFNPSFFLHHKSVSNSVSIIFKYWYHNVESTEDTFRLQWEDHAKKPIDLEQKDPDQTLSDFPSSDPIPMTQEDWQEYILVTKDTSKNIFFQNISVQFRASIDLDQQTDQPTYKIEDKNEGFDVSSPDSTLNIFTLKNGKEGKKAVLKIKITKENFPKTCFLTSMKAILVLDEKRAIDLPLVQNSEPLCLGDILALNIMKETMIKIEVDNPDTSDFFLLKTGPVPHTFQIQNVKPPSGKIQNNWIFNHPQMDHSLYLKTLKNVDQDTKLYACDVTANCFEYLKKDNTFILNEESLQVLRNSPIIRIMDVSVSPIPDVDYDENKWMENRFRTQLWDNFKIFSDGKPTSNFDLNNIKTAKITSKDSFSTNAKITVEIPYIDLRVYEAIVYFDDPKKVNINSVSIFNGTNMLSKMELENLKSNSLNNGKIPMSLFLNPKPDEIFESYRFQFNFTITETGAGKINVEIKPKSPTIPKTETWFDNGWKTDVPTMKFDVTGSCKFPNSQKLSVVRFILQSDGRIQSKTLEITDKDDIQESADGPFKIIYYSSEGKIPAASNFEKIDHNPLENPDKIEKGTTSGWYKPEYDGFRCPTNFRFDRKQKTCVLARVYKDIIIGCNSSIGCSNILDRPLMLTDLYIDSNHGTLKSKHLNFRESSKDIYIPYGNNGMVIPNNQIAVKRPTILPGDKDFCLNFNYDTSNIAALYVDFNEKSDAYKYRLDQPNSVDSPMEICASHLAPYPDEVNFTVFWFESFSNSDSPFTYMLPYLADIENNSSGNSIPPPSNGIFQDRVIKTDFLPFDEEIFSIVDDSILFVLDPLTDKEKKFTKDFDFERRLTTKFINLDNPLTNLVHHISLGLEHHGNFIEKGGEILIQFRPNSQTQQTYNLKDLDSNKVNQLTYSVDSQNPYGRVQLQFVFRINRLKINETLEYTLEKFSVNDPCVESDNTLKKCNNHGHCERAYMPQPESFCRCDQWYGGVNCEMVDWCSLYNKHKYCLNHNYGVCKITDQDAGWECSCYTGEKWIRPMEMCLRPLNKTCGEHEHLQFTKKDDGRNEQPICECDPDYVRMNGQCVPFDVCDSKHRKIKGMSEKPCSHPLAQCQKQSTNDYHCVCPAPLNNVNGNFKSDAICRDIPCDLDLRCEHKCVFNATSGGHKCECFNRMYTLQPDGLHCTINNKDDLKKCLPDNGDPGYPAPYLDFFGHCKCKNGYDYDQKNKKCVQKDELGQKLHCQKLTVKDADSWDCSCNSDEEFDTSMAQCRLKQCSHPDEIRFASNPYDLHSWKCISACDPEFIGKRCKPFSHCEPESVIKMLNNKRNIFRPGDAPSKSCQCDLGFEFQPTNSDDCQPIQQELYKIHLDFLANPSSQRETSEFFFQQLLNRTLSVTSPKQKGEILFMKCEETTGETFGCDATIQLNSLTKDEVETRLNNSCIQTRFFYDNRRPDTCAYVLADSVGSKHYSVLLVRKIDETTSLDPFQYCSDSQPCKYFRDSKCYEANPSRTFQCNCDDKYYKTDELVPTPGPNYHSCIVKSCKERGYHCSDQTAQCWMMTVQDNRTLLAKVLGDHFLAGSNDVEPVHPLCRCPNDFLEPVNGTCKENCDLKCNGHGTCRYLRNEEQWCHCEKDWAGDNCDISISKNHDDDHHDQPSTESGNGFKISTIVLAIITALLIIGIIYLYLQRRS